MNALLSLSAAERARGAVAASTGNHAAAVAWCLERLDAPGVIFMPDSASPAKVSAVERLGVEIRRVPGDPIEAELRARRYADERGATYVSPYNDARVIAGQGTIAIELEQQADPIDAVFVSVGGGGLISGIAGYLKRVRPGVRVIGCSPENSAVMIHSQEAGRLVELPCLPTLSDGTAGGIERDSITFELCRTLVDEYVTVTEDEIRQALRAFVEVHHMLIEGAAAVTLASFLKLRQRFRGRSVVVVICGGNIDLETLGTIL
jgi:threonine dehydratase